MASDRNVRQIVAAEINATTPRRISSRASSEQLQRDSGTPVVAGSSHANALISAFTEGGKDPGPAASRSVLKALQSLIDEPLTPPVHHLRTGIEPGSDIHIRQPLSREQHDLGPHHLRIRSCVTPSPTFELPALVCGQYDLERAHTAPSHGVPPHGTNATPPTPPRRNPIKSHQCSSAVDHLVAPGRLPGRA